MTDSAVRWQGPPGTPRCSDREQAPNGEGVLKWWKINVYCHASKVGPD